MTRFALAALAVGMLACGTEETPSPATGAGGSASTTTTTAGNGASGGHGCFSTEDTCDGKCVDVQTNAEHCGMCGHSCADGPNSIGSCVDGQCSAACASGFADTGNGCQNFFGAHEAYPDACAGCAVQNQISGDCACPVGTDALPLLVQSDCPGMPMRATTEMRRTRRSTRARCVRLPETARPAAPSTAALGGTSRSVAPPAFVSTMSTRATEPAVGAGASSWRSRARGAMAMAPPPSM